MVVPATQRTRATASVGASKAATGKGMGMVPPPPPPHWPSELSPHAYSSPPATTAAEWRAPAATWRAGGNCSGSCGFWKPCRRAECGPAAAAEAQPRQCIAL
eukprot:scaffold237597_cov37-Tisochrysis_lutea.AAC.5